MQKKVKVQDASKVLRKVDIFENFLQVFKKKSIHQVVERYDILILILYFLLDNNTFLSFAKCVHSKT